MTFTLCGPSELAGAHLVLHLVLLEQVADALLQLVGDAAAAADDLGEVDLQVVERDAALGGFGADLADEAAVFEQRLGRDAAPVEAGAAEVFLLDAEDALFELPGADGGRVTGGAAADDDDVEVVALSGWSGAAGDFALGRRGAAWLRRGLAGSRRRRLRFRGRRCGCRRAPRPAQRSPLAAGSYFFFTSSAFSFPVAITASTAPTGDFSPSCTTITASVPLSNASIAMTALSVSTSAISSPALTLSPSFLCHLTTVPSVIVSDSCGIVISAGMANPRRGLDQHQAGLFEKLPQRAEELGGAVAPSTAR